MARRHRHIGLTGTALGVTGLAIAWPLAAALAGDTSYRWVDDEGEVHYGDRLSPEQAKRKHEVVDESGIVRDERNPEGNGEANAEAEAGSGPGEGADRTEAGETASDGEDAGPAPREDEMLLEAFATERMLIEARDRRLDALQSRIDLTRQNIERLASSYANRRERLGSLPADSDQSAEVEKRLRELERRMTEQREHLSTLQAQKAKLEAQFEADLERYRELRSDDDSQ